MPKGDRRFHPYQKLKRGHAWLGCRVCVCDNCGWKAFFNTRILPWQGAFIHEESLRRFFDHAGGPYNVKAMRNYYEKGEIDVTWHCIWCLSKARKRSVHQICKDYKLYSKNARERSQGWWAWSLLIGWAQRRWMHAPDPKKIP